MIGTLTGELCDVEVVLCVEAGERVRVLGMLWVDVRRAAGAQETAHQAVAI